VVGGLHQKGAAEGAKGAAEGAEPVGMPYPREVRPSETCLAGAL
jgi:hypothetical protein